MNEHDISERVRNMHNIARQESEKNGKAAVEQCTPPAWQDVLGNADQFVRQKPIFSRHIKGTVLENDVPVWIADFALQMLHRETARLKAVAIVQSHNAEVNRNER